MSTLPLRATKSAVPSSATAPAARPGLLARRREALLGLTGIVAVLALWQISAWTGFVDPTFSSSPIGSASALWTMLTTDATLWSAISETLETIAIGVGLSIAAGIPIGLIIGRTPVLRELLEPWIAILYSVPYVVFLPIIIFWVGIGQEARVVLVVWSAIFPLLISTIAAARNLDRRYLAVSKVFCAPRVRTLRSIVFPATLPYILAGVRLAVGRGLVGAIVAELFMGTSGLGNVVQTNTSNFEMDDAMGAIVIIAVIAIALTRAIAWLERRYTHWSEA